MTTPEQRERRFDIIIAVIFILLLLFILLANRAMAAPAEYCRPYAAQLSQKLIIYVWNRAYTTCLNQDEPPALPATTSEGWSIVFDKPPVILTPPLPPDRPEINPKAGWYKQCARNFRSWDQASETVIRWKRGKRVTCPCGTKVVCR